MAMWRRRARATRSARCLSDRRQVRQRQDVFSGAVYCSQNDLTLHFGLGARRRSISSKSNGLMEYGVF